MGTTYLVGTTCSCGNDLLTCGNDFLTCGNELLTCGNELLSCCNDILTCGNNLFSFGNEIKKIKKQFLSLLAMCFGVRTSPALLRKYECTQLSYATINQGCVFPSLPTHTEKAMV